MNKGELINTVMFMQAIKDGKVVNFKIHRKLGELIKSGNVLKAELEELQKIEADDKEDGIAKFLEEPTNLEPLNVDDFNELPPTDSYLITKQEGRPDKAVTFPEIAEGLQALNIIK
jgi:hypothetical protein